MAYQAKLNGGQTLIRVFTDSQHQSSSASTGEWKIAPTLFQTDDGAVVEIHTGDGSVYFQVKNGQLHSLNQAPPLEEAEHLDLKEVEDGTGESKMKPMEPMKPMKLM